MPAKKTLAIVFFTVFLDLVGFGIIIPIQPFYAETLGATPSVVTLLGASFSLMQFLFAAFWGRLSDKIGRRPVLLTSISISCLGYLLFGLSNSLGMLFAARILAGFGSANIAAAQAIIADSTSPEKRAKGMGLIGVAFGLGFIFGPALGGSLVQFGLPVPALAAAGLCALNWVFAFFQLPETYSPDRDRHVSHRHAAFSWKALKHAARHPNVPQLFALYLVFTVAFSLMEQVLGLFIEHTWVLQSHAPTNLHAKEAAALTTYVLVIIGATAIIVQGGLIGRLVRRFGERALLIAGTAIVGISFFSIPVVGMARVFGFMLFISVLMAVGTGITNPSLSGLLSRSVERNEQGGALGIGQSLGALGRVLGPSVAGILFQANRGFPFWVGAALLFICSGIAVTIRKN